jgi:hypothetical protein
MGFFDIFRRPRAVQDGVALAEFIDRNAAFLIQKGMYEYARARAGHYAKVLMNEPEFLTAMEEARWRGYPLGLAMVAEMVEKVLDPLFLDPLFTDDRHTGIAALEDLVLSVFDRYPVPQPFGSAVWEDERRELARRLELIGLHPPKMVKDIPSPFAKLYFEMMPIHEKLRAPDFLAISNYLRVSLINIHDELIKRIDTPAVVRSLLAERAEQ